MRKQLLAQWIEEGESLHSFAEDVYMGEESEEAVCHTIKRRNFKENRCFNIKEVIRMKKEDFMSWLEEKQDALAMWNVSVDEENLSDFVVGCFFDSKSATWKVYINKERGKHRVRLETKDEEQAFNKLRALVEYVIENNRGYI